MKCKYPKCTTKKNKYNESKYCSVHQRRGLKLDLLKEQDELYEEHAKEDIRVSQFVPDIKELYHFFDHLDVDDVTVVTKILTSNKYYPQSSYALYKFN